MRRGRAAPKLDASLFDEPLNLRPRMTRDQADEEVIQPLASFGRGHLKNQTFDLLNGGTPQAARLRMLSGAGAAARRLSHNSMMMLSGPMSSEMNCDVDTPNTMPRSSPR